DSGELDLPVVASAGIRGGVGNGVVHPDGSRAQHDRDRLVRTRNALSGAYVWRLSISAHSAELISSVASSGSSERAIWMAASLSAARNRCASGSTGRRLSTPASIPASMLALVMP